jgi:hypothetical protein
MRGSRLGRGRRRARRGSRGVRRGTRRRSRAPRRSTRAHGAPRRVLGDQRLVALQELLDLDRVVGQRLGRGVDRGQAAADHHHRQAQLHVGDGVLLGRARELQRHQEVRRRAHAARQPVGHVEHRRLAGARRTARCGRSPCRSASFGVSVPPKRTPPNIAKALRRSSSRRMSFRKFLSQRTVMPYSATPPKPAIMRASRSFVERRDIADRREGHALARHVDAGSAGAAARSSVRRCRPPCGRRSSGVRQREAGRPQADDQHALAGIGPSAAGGAG